MQLFLFFFSSPKSNGGGGTELHRSGLIPDRQKNTNKINLCQLPPGAGMKEHNGTLPKQKRGRERGRKERSSKTKKRKDTLNRKKNNRGDQYWLTITLVWSRGNGKAYCIRLLDGSPWSGEARIVLMHLTFYCNQTGQLQKK